MPSVPISFATGKETLKFIVQADPSLTGQVVYVQALIANQTNPVGDAHLTGYTADLIIR